LLTRLIYASTITDDFAHSSIEEILRSARKYNEKRNLTGLLCFDTQYFLQCLEGSRAEVNAIYKTILKDSRHNDIIMLDYQEINHRDFADWKMGYIPSSRISKNLTLKFSVSSEFNPYKMTSKNAHLMMLELKNSLTTV
jgi:hypothetical protein